MILQYDSNPAGRFFMRTSVLMLYRQLELGEALTEKRLKVKDPMTMLIDLYRMSGFSGLFTGIVPRLARVAPACAVMITTYEGFKAHFVRRIRERRNDLSSVGGGDATIDKSPNNTSGDSNNQKLSSEVTSIGPVSMNRTKQIDLQILTSSGLAFNAAESQALISS